MKIARVFPTRTNMCPQDEDAYFGPPLLGCPHYDEVHVSVTFTWDVAKGEYLRRQWRAHGFRVRIGGPAMGDQGDDFVPGRYLRNDVVITSRGCPNRCDFCLVPEREGRLRELPITEGHIVQDNNFLACSSSHIEAVFWMLARRKNGAVFSGGLQPERLTYDIGRLLNNVGARSIFLAYDQPANDEALLNAVAILREWGFSRDKIRCYVLIGREGDTIKAATKRLRFTWDAGTLPFAMRYCKPVDKFKDRFEQPGKEWMDLTAKWVQPGIIKATMRGAAR